MKWNNYYRQYRRQFPSQWRKPLRILEVGVWKGDGLRWLGRLYPNALLFGIDLKVTPEALGCGTLFEENVCRLKESTLEKLEPLDIVIDDGGHRPYQQALAFRQLWPLVREGGFYVVEDLHLAQRLRWRVFKRVLPWLSMDWILRRMVAGMSRWDGAETPGLRSPVEISYTPQLVIIRKASVFMEVQ